MASRFARIYTTAAVTDVMDELRCGGAASAWWAPRAGCAWR